MSNHSSVAQNLGSNKNRIGFLSSFFLFCSGVYPTLLKRSPSETQKYIGVGATVFFTGILAFISASYAVFTVFDSYMASIIFGIIWGLMIFNLDRYLVSSMRKSDSKWKDLFSATPRILLAILIAVVISKPLEVKLFDTEIQSELVLMEQERFLNQEQVAKARYSGDISDRLNRIKSFEDKLFLERAKVDELRNNAIAEADGTGGSGQRNMGPIYKMKKAEADAAELKYNNLKESLNNVMVSDIARVDNLRLQSNETLEGLEQASLTGLASRLNALGRMSDKNITIYWASIFIMFLFIAVECAPILVKIITEKGPYDYMLSNLEHKYKSKAVVDIALLEVVNEVEISYAQKTRIAQNSIRIEAENDIYRAAIQNTKDEILSDKPTWPDLKKEIFSWQ